MIELSSNVLLIAFIAYALATIAFFIAITGKKFSSSISPEEHEKRFGRIGYGLAVVGVLLHVIYNGLRWYIGGHIPTSNMFEFMQFLGMSMALAFLIIYRMYRLPIIGAFVMPFAVLVIAYASIFPSKITPLIPALQSYWLQIHVSTSALGEGAFAVGFAAGLMYLLKTVDQSKSSKSTRWLEFVMWVVLSLLAFIVITFTFKAMDYQATFKAPVEQSGMGTVETQIVYSMPAIVGPQDGVLVSTDKMSPLMEVPSWMKGKDAARKFNTMVWSTLAGSALYLVIRLALRKRLAVPLSRLVQDLDDKLVDEISYRAIAIGFPIFTLGALFFAMIWANEAWGRFWGWDPKEVWALITWLFYSAYLHLRLNRGWFGTKSAWMAVIGFIVVMFNLIFVNLVIPGLHAYA